MRLPLAEFRALLDNIAGTDAQFGAVRDLELLEFAAVRINDRQFAVALQRHERLGSVCLDDLDLQAVAQLDGSARSALVAVLEQCTRCSATGVERAHGELRTRLTDRLRGNDAHGHADFNRRAGRHVLAVALRTDAACGLARERRAHIHAGHAEILDLACDRLRDDLVATNDRFIGDRIDDRLHAGTTADDVAQGHINLVAL